MKDYMKQVVFRYKDAENLRGSILAAKILWSSASLGLNLSLAREFAVGIIERGVVGPFPIKNSEFNYMKVELEAANTGISVEEA